MTDPALGRIPDSVLDGLLAGTKEILACCHLLRHGLDFVSCKDRKGVATALKDIYRAIDAGLGARSYFSTRSPPTYVVSYTTNAIQALNAKMWRAV